MTKIFEYFRTGTWTFDKWIFRDQLSERGAKYSRICSYFKVETSTIQEDLKPSYIYLNRRIDSLPWQVRNDSKSTSPHGRADKTTEEEHRIWWSIVQLSTKWIAVRSKVCPGPRFLPRGILRPIRIQGNIHFARLTIRISRHKTHMLGSRMRVNARNFLPLSLSLSFSLASSCGNGKLWKTSLYILAESSGSGILGNLYRFMPAISSTRERERKRVSVSETSVWSPLTASRSSIYYKDRAASRGRIIDKARRPASTAWTAADIIPQAPTVSFISFRTSSPPSFCFLFNRESLPRAEIVATIASIRFCQDGKKEESLWIQGIYVDFRTLNINK